MTTSIYKVSRTRGSVTKSNSISYNNDLADEGQDVTIDQANKRVDMAFAVANLIGCQITTDAEVILNTNAVDGSGGNTLTITPEKPIFWYLDAQWACPFTHDVTKFYFDNPNVTDGSAPVVTIAIDRVSGP